MNLKKVFLTLTVALMGVTAIHAQLVIGGSLGVGGEIGSKTVVNDLITKKGSNTFNFSFVPRVSLEYVFLIKYFTTASIHTD